MSGRIRSSRRPLIVAAGAALVTAFAGGAMTRIDDWYRGLEKSALNPPDWAFAPAWTVIYALAVLAAVSGWKAARTSAERAWLISLFFFNALLNIAWSGIFFTLRRPDWALAEVAMLWLSVAMLIVLTVRFSRAAALYLAPYLAWVSFAAWLNYRVVVLNGPFG
ncbi:TspO/MBR family protein [Hyphomonas sp.]|uniref:TspO/MBR family protein n=1 Tax=Hyphomonas sp. TaxID=87 RepID=UPI00391D22A5